MDATSKRQRRLGRSQAGLSGESTKQGSDGKCCIG